MFIEKITFSIKGFFIMQKYVEFLAVVAKVDPFETYITFI